MESVILSGPSQCKIKRKFPLPNRVEEPQEQLDCMEPDPRPSESNFKDDEFDPHYLWRRNAPFLYDSLLIHRLDWPSLVVEFMEDSTIFRAKNGSSSHKLLLGTHTSGSEANFVMIAELRLGVSSLQEDLSSCENYKGFYSARKQRVGGSMNNFLPSLEIKAKLIHPGEINRISHAPESNFIFATQSNNGNLLVFDYSKHPSNPRNSEKSIPQILLAKGHNSEGYGAFWKNRNELVSCAHDGSICIWDLGITQNSRTNHLDGVEDGVPVVEPFKIFHVTNESKAVALNDIKCLPNCENLICTVSDDASARLFDLRTHHDVGDHEDVILKDEDGSELICLSFNEFNSNYLVTGGSNGIVTLWDIRKNDKSVIKLQHHTGSISQVEFCGASAGLLASASEDSTVCIWDISHPFKQLRFIHAGHRGQVNDISWVKSAAIRNSFTLASVAADNTLHCFSPSYLTLYSH